MEKNITTLLEYYEKSGNYPEFKQRLLLLEPNIIYSHNVEVPNPKYRLGAKQKRAILEVATGHEFLTFPPGKEAEAAKFLNYLNQLAALQ